MGERRTASKIRLVCLDFDGTAVDYDGDLPFFHPAVSAELDRIASLGVRWCTNSGRSREDQEQILRRSRVRGLRHLPVALICSEAFIFESCGDGEYAPAEPWNSKALELLIRVQRKVQEALRPYLDGWRVRYEPEVRWGAEYTVFCVAETEGRADAFHTELSNCLKHSEDVCITRNGGWIVVLPKDLGKGNVLREFARRIGVRGTEVLAVGDHLNDLSMLAEGVAGSVGCPADARAAVIDAVRKAGGYVATEPGPLGTAEILREFILPF